MQPRTPPPQVLAALEAAAQLPKPPLSSMYDDVYDTVPWHLAAQRAATLELAARNPGLCPPDVPVR